MKYWRPITLFNSKEAGPVSGPAYVPRPLAIDGKLRSAVEQIQTLSFKLNFLKSNKMADLGFPSHWHAFG